MCTNPLLGIRTVDKSTGSFVIKFYGSAARKDPLKFNDNIIKIPCGQCMECRLANARMWTIRILHECVLHKHCSFVTLTYNDDSLPENGTLVKKHVQDFLKNLRIKLFRKHGVKIRFYCAGEYGSLSYRPHYHLIIFGWDFPDRRLFSRGKSGFNYYRSPLLESVWSYGFSSVGNVTYNSVAYVAKYVTKKIKGDLAKFHYDGVIPEFATMSRRPGIAHDFVVNYTDDIYNYDKVDFKGFQTRPPLYYDHVLSELDPVRFCRIKDERKVKSIDYNQKVHDRFFSSDDPFSYLEYERFLKDRELSNVKDVNKFKEMSTI